MDARDPGQGDAFLRIAHVSKSFDGGSVVLDDVDLSVAKGEMVALLGASGCGKTTLLRSVAGLSLIDSGAIEIDGRSMEGVEAADRGVGVVFQNYALFPHMTVAQNVAYGLAVRKMPKDEIAARVAETLALVGLKGFEQRKPKALSGGQQQRVAVARALAIRPRLLLLDEPMSGLDPQLREGLRMELRALQQRLGITTLIVTHDQADAFSICDRVALMSKGKVLQYDAAATLHDFPATLEAATAFGRSNALEGVVERPGELTVGTARLRIASAASGPAVAVLRPHEISLRGSRAAKGGGEIDSATGVIKAVYSGGDALHYLVATEAFELKVTAPVVHGAAGFKVGDAVRCEWRVEALKLFPTP